VQSAASPYPVGAASCAARVGLGSETQNPTTSPVSLHHLSSPVLAIHAHGEHAARVQLALAFSAEATASSDDRSASFATLTVHWDRYRLAAMR
jgi:hypothetical protein